MRPEQVNLGSLKDGEAFQRSLKGKVFRVVEKDNGDLITCNSIHSNRTYHWPRRMKVYPYSGYVPDKN